MNTKAQIVLLLMLVIALLLATAYMMRTLYTFNYRGGSVVLAGEEYQFGHWWCNDGRAAMYDVKVEVLTFDRYDTGYECTKFSDLLGRSYW